MYNTPNMEFKVALLLKSSKDYYSYSSVLHSLYPISSVSWYLRKNTSYCVISHSNWDLQCWGCQPRAERCWWETIQKNLNLLPTSVHQSQDLVSLQIHSKIHLFSLEFMGMVNMKAGLDNTVFLRYKAVLCVCTAVLILLKTIIIYIWQYT